VRVKICGVRIGRAFATDQRSALTILFLTCGLPRQPFTAGKRPSSLARNAGSSAFASAVHFSWFSNAAARIFCASAGLPLPVSTTPAAHIIASDTAQAPGCIGVDSIQLQVESSGKSTDLMSSFFENSVCFRRVSKACRLVLQVLLDTSQVLIMWITAWMASSSSVAPDRRSL
jgi:hypothetical protein